jgi:hypothetical protein
LETTPDGPDLLRTPTQYPVPPFARSQRRFDLVSLEMEKQELVDRLVTAVGEGDVLYTLYWIKEMRGADILKECLQAERTFPSPLP